MCGIAGIYSKNRPIEALNKIAKNMANTISHRGPDDSGVWCSEGIGLSHRRLSIVDLSNAGHQPMLSDCGRYTLVFNGEIYNHHSIRKQLKSTNKNIIWRGDSDTEVLLNAIVNWGIENSLKFCEGMFAIALWDSIDQKLFLARDRFGEKPLYYGYVNNDFVFASELKAIKIHPDFNNELNREAISNFLSLSYIPCPLSIYKGISKLPPSHILCINFLNKNETITSYWKLSINKNIDFSNDNFIIENLHKSLSKAVSDQMIADVPVGAFLSGGIDSSLIVALMQENSNNPVNTFTIGYENLAYDESVYARSVAKYLGTNHNELVVSAQDLLDVVPKLPSLYDEPFADSSQVPTFLVSQLARNNVTVALTGDGGDEVFGGYNRHLWAHKFWNKIRLLPRWLRNSISNILASPSENKWNQIYSLIEFIIPKHYQISLPGEKIHKISKSLSTSTVDELYSCLISTWDNANSVVLDLEKVTQSHFNLEGETSAEQLMFLDLNHYLPDDILTKVDRASMGVSLETRAPFLNHNVIEYAWNMPLHMKIRNGKGKWVLRKILENYIPKNLIDRPKMGFGVPIDEWLRGPLMKWSLDLLSESLIVKDDIFDFKKIDTLQKEHKSGKKKHHHKLWNILMFQSWLHYNH